MKVLAPLHRWVAEPPPREVAEALERLRRGEDVAWIAVMPDVHLAEDVCVGTVLATAAASVCGASRGLRSARWSRILETWGFGRPVYCLCSWGSWRLRRPEPATGTPRR